MICLSGMQRSYSSHPLTSGGVSGLVLCIVLSLLMQIKVAMAIFSELVVITPQNETEHPFDIQVVAIENRPGDHRIRVAGPVDDDQKTWLIRCQRSLLPEKQNFRQAIWQGGTGNRDVVQIMRLTPQYPADKAGMEKQVYVEVVLSDDVMKRSYLYVDFPQNVDDGGYHYSIDLAYYLPGPAGKKSMIRWEHNP
jgi:hypothetical protein